MDEELVDKKGERGFVVPAALMVMMILLLLIGAMVVSAVGTNDTAATQLNAIRAQQAADAGLRAAVYDYNALGIDASALLTGQGLSSTIKSASSDAQISGMNDGGGPEQILGGCYNNASGGSTVVKDPNGTTTAPGWCNPVVDDIGTAVGSSGAPVSYSYVVSPPYQSIDSLINDDVTSGSGDDCIGSNCTTNILASLLNAIFCILVCSSQTYADAEFGADDYRTIVSTGVAGNETRTAEEVMHMKGDLLGAWESTETCIIIFICSWSNEPVQTAKDPYGNYALNGGGSATDGVGAGGFFFTQYYEPIVGSYRQCSSAAYAVASGTAVPASDCSDD